MKPLLRIMFPLIGMLSLLLGAVSPASACPPVWDVYTAISVGSITSPTAGSTYAVNTEVSCSIAAGSDRDHRYVPPSNHTYPADTLTYTWSASAGTFPYGNTGTSVTWKAPSTPNSGVTITCTISDAAVIPPGETGTRNDTDKVRTVSNIKVYDLSVQSSKSIIMTGGVQNAVHQCTITATVTPAMTGNVSFSIVSGTGVGYSIPASLSATSVPLNGNSQAQTVLTSSDLEETVTVEASFAGCQATVQVNQGTSDMSFEFDPEEIIADGESTMDVNLQVLQQVTHTPVPGHAIEFSIVDVTDEYENPIDPSEWADYGTLTTSADTTDTSGIATAVLQAGTKGGVITIEAADNNDYYYGEGASLMKGPFQLSLPTRRKW